MSPLRWFVVAVNASTGNREIVAESLHREAAVNHKIDLQEQTPRHYVGVTVEYGRRDEWERDNPRVREVQP